MIKKINKDEVELKFYGEIGRWTLRSGKTFSQIFNELDSKYKKITIRLHCYGGEVIEGNVIYNAIANANAEVTIIIDGVAASMGSIIMLAGTKLKMAENAFIMIHNPSGGAWGNAAAHLSVAKVLRSMERNFAKKYAAKTGKPGEDCKKYFDGSDHWIDADEALKMKLVDEVIEPVVRDIKKLDKAKAETMGIQAVCDSFCALVDDNSKPNNESNLKSKMDKQKLISHYNLEGVTAESSDTAIMEALDKKLNAEKSAKEAAEAKLKEAKESEISDLIEAKASEEGVEITAEQKETYKKIGEAAGTEALKTALAGVTPRTPLAKMVTNTSGKSGSKDNRKDWTWQDYESKAPEDLEKMEDSDPEKFKALYKEEFGELPE